MAEAGGERVTMRRCADGLARPSGARGRELRSPSDRHVLPWQARDCARFPCRPHICHPVYRLHGLGWQMWMASRLRCDVMLTA